MSITLHKGPTGSGKTSALHGILGDPLSSGAIYVLPSEGTASVLRNEFLRAKGSLIGDVFVSWNKFLKRVADPASPALHSNQIPVLILKLLGECDLKYFGTTRPSIGIARQFADAIISIKKNGIDPKRLANILETRGGLKESDLLTIYRAYESEKTRLGIIDDGDHFLLAMDKIRSGNSSISRDTKAIIFDEFASISPGHLSMLKTISDELPRLEVHISFPEATTDGALYHKYLEKHLARLAAISDAVRTYDGKQADPPMVESFSARSPIQEARHFINRLSDLAREEGYTDGNIALITRNDSNFIYDFVQEAKSSGLLDSTFNTGVGFESPAIHELLAPQIIENWPSEGTFEDFILLCSEHFKKTESIEMWCKRIHDDCAGQSGPVRSLSCLASLDMTLRGFLSLSELIEIEKISRENFIQILVQESRTSSAFLNMERNLPFRHVVYEFGLATNTDTVIIPQMLEGNIPRAQGEKLFFADNDTLSPDPDTTIDEIFVTVEDALAKDAYLYDTFLSKSKRVILTHSIISESGAETLKSSFLDGLDSMPLPPLGLHPLAARDQTWDKRLEQLVNVEAQRSKGLIKNPEYHGKLTCESTISFVRKRYTEGRFSATSLEKYAECPFFFFVEKILGLEQVDEDIPELLPKERGTIFHTVLERFYSEHADVFTNAIENRTVEESIDEILDTLIARTLEENKEAIAGVAPGLKPLQTQAIKTLAKQVISMELSEKRSLATALMPLVCEWAFGEDDVPCLEVPVDDDKPAKLHGFIDRIDADEKKRHFLVVDYKTGSNVKSMKKEILEGRKLQLPIYVEAAKRFLLPNSNPLGGLLIDVMKAEKRHGFVKKEYNETYFSVGRSHSAMDDDTWNDALGAAMSAISAYASSIRNGEFFAKPAKGCPGYCNYADICRYSGRSSD